MDIALGLVAVVVLILINAFFVGVEFALVAADRNAIEALAEEGDRRAAAALKALKSLSFELSGAQLGITISSIVLGYVAEPTLARLLDPGLQALGLPEGTSLGISLALALVIATSVQMVLGELVPKNIAISRPVPTAMALGGPGRAANRLMKPLILVFNGAANWTVRLLGVEPKDELTTVRSLEEIERLIHSSRDGGFLPQEEFSLLSRSISFAGKTAADALVPRTAIVGLQENVTLHELARIALECGHSRFPVYGENLDDIKGIVLVKEMFAIPHEKRRETSVRAVTQEPLIVPESRDLESLLLELRRLRKQMAVVVDEYGGTAGIITIEDILEEIVGDIEDEYDLSGTTQLTTPALKGVNVVGGMLHPDEVREQTGLELPEGDYETLAGFILSLCGHIPEKGEHISFGDWEFKIVEMERKRIDRVLVVAPGESAEPEEGAEPS